MAITSIEGVELGGLYTTGKNSVWEVKSYAQAPTITLKNLRTGEEIFGGVGCLNFAPFVKLVPDSKISEEEETDLPPPGGLPLGTWMKRQGDGSVVVVVPGGPEHADARFYGKTPEEARQKARTAQGGKPS